MREEKGMCRMKNKGKKYAMLLVLAVAVAGGYGAARETFAATFAEQPQQEQSLRRSAFEEQIARERAEFDKEYNEVKKMCDRIDQKFRDCREASEEELRAAVTKNRRKHVRE